MNSSTTISSHVLDQITNALLRLFRFFDFRIKRTESKYLLSLDNEAKVLIL